MNYYIDGNWTPINYFWSSLQGLATDTQRMMLLEGKKILIGGRTYFIDGIEEEPVKTEQKQ